MIERARIVTSGKIKTSLSAVKDNINFWNDLHQLGLTGFREEPNAAVWSTGNCLIAARGMGLDLTEILLLVAQKQPSYQWTIGRWPEEQAQDSWNRLFRLFPSEARGDRYALVGPGYRRVSWEIELFARVETPPPRGALDARVNQRLEAKYTEAERTRHFNEEMAKLQQEIDRAKDLKREQDALQDLTSDQLAQSFFEIVRPGNQVTTTLNKRAADVQTGEDTQPFASARNSEPFTRGQVTEKERGGLESIAQSNVASPEPPKSAGRGKVKRIRNTAKIAKTESRIEKDVTHPKRKTTEAKWRRDWKLIKPLFDEGTEIGVIAGLLNMSRERVSKIIAWADPKSA